MNTFTMTNRLAARFVAVLAVFSLLMSLVPIQALAVAVDKPINCPGGQHLEGDVCVVDLNPNVKICHANNGENFYTYPTVDAKSIVNLPNGHKDHDDGGLNDMGDIIPSFKYNFGEGELTFPGKNLTTEYSNGKTGAQILENKCSLDFAPVVTKLTVVKSVVNDNGGTMQVVDFPLFVNAAPVVSGVASEYAPGTYTVSETSSQGYVATFGGACDENGSVTLEAGDDKTCTITNDDVPPVPGCTDSTALNPTRGANVDDGSCQYMCAYSDEGTVGNGQASVSTYEHSAWADNLTSDVGEWIWSLDAAENATFTKTFFVNEVPAGGTLRIAADNSYQVFLNGDPTPLSCDGSGIENFAAEETCSAPIVQGLNTLTVVASNFGGPNTNNDTNPAGLIFELVSNDSTCSAVEDLGSITIEKEVVGFEGDWSFNFDGDLGEFALSNLDANTTFDDLVAGSYDFSEEIPEGWDLTDVSCVSTGVEDFAYAAENDTLLVTLDAGADVTCTFENTKEVTPVCPMGDNLLVNGSFEEPIVTANGGQWEIFAAVTGWTIDLFKSTGLELWKGIGIGASEGLQNAELDGEDATKITQVVAGLTPNATYELRFDFAARTADAADNNMNVLLDGAVTQNVSTANTAWTTYTQSFVATDADIEVGFEDIGTAQAQGGTGSLLDNAVLCLVELPDDGGGEEDDLTCELTASDTSIRRGSDVTLSWDIVGDFFSAVLTNSSNDDEIEIETAEGSREEEDIDEDTTYTLTVLGDYLPQSEEREEVTCEVSIDTRSGGGGGGTRVDRDGRVAGDSTSKPEGQVLGDQVSVVPLGAAAAGAGGAAPVELPGLGLTAAAFLARRK